MPAARMRRRQAGTHSALTGARRTCGGTGREAIPSPHTGRVADGGALPPLDEVNERLERLAADIESQLGDAVAIHREDILGGSWTLRPVNARSLGVSWIDLGLDLQVETASGLGGRFELERAQTDVAFIEDIVWSVVAGRVEEVFAPGRSQVSIVLSDGTRVREIGGDAPMGCLPLIGWRWWGSRVRYEPYVP